LGGPCLDYTKLVNLGIPGLRKEVSQWKRINNNAAPYFYDSLKSALDILTQTLSRYADEAETRAEKATETSEDNRTGERFLRIGRSCRNLITNPPSCYHEAIQLLWLFSLHALTRNYGRLDVTLAPFLCRDLNTGRITETEAFDLTLGLWRMIQWRGDNFNNRIIIGGRGRPDPQTADRWALLALQVQRAAGGSIPQLSLRCYKGMNPILLERGLEVIADGSTFPMLYNDDVNVPAIARAFGVSAQEAEQAIPYGCGEMVLDHSSVGSPDAALNVLKALDVTLRNGRDGFFDEPRGLALGHLQDYAAFTDLLAAFKKQIEYHVDLLAQVQTTVYRITAEAAAFPFLSLLYDDCIRRGKPLLAGGVRHLGGTLESFGNNTAADALLAIKRLIYDEMKLTPHQLMTALDADFDGYERERRLMRALPKFGNDDPEADELSLWVNQIVGQAAQNAGRRVGLDNFLMVLVNNGDSVMFGRFTAASADGRKSGEPLSNANQPSAGMDRSGLTALLNSMAKLDASLHAGAVHNLKLCRSLMNDHTRQIASLIRGYFLRGGAQLMITVTDRDELERALQYPEAFGHLIVRVGGYSEHFVKLPADIQREIINRTLY